MPHIAFYAPLKPPDHPTPSGDRETARLFLAALQGAGFEADVASTLRTADSAGGWDFSEPAQAEASRLLALYREQPQERPALWFTYHVYYKAPDLVGPAIARALGIPYVIAEGSRAPKRAQGAWSRGHAQAEAALDAATLILILNPNDRAMLEAARPDGQALVDLPPFIDAAGWPLLERSRPAPGFCRLLSVAMMRERDKLASYEILAAALAGLGGDHPWHLDIVGDGPARPHVEALFAPFGERVALHGRIDDRARLALLYAQADLLAWPAVNEAFGMVFLEAALQGCPAVAGAFGGVGSVVRDGHTGLLTKPGDIADFSAALARLMRDTALRQLFSGQSLAFARQERSLASASGRLRELLLPLVQPGKPAA
ncbi:glycosyltransferase family 4 protein [Labrys sp. LIt4]|uniref:glycosyltransferase family 4 protein n=1 Tax=Labrys sp. LIt4 TaxID=2821355 RepID=UPI001AE03402|nr:glycosyltransferase family 4 protein [Labrys sp. LIt4]MBP0579668.1 glycosyltransferase family 4 protein [Labrys sp. LIt4]